MTRAEFIEKNRSTCDFYVISGSEWIKCKDTRTEGLRDGWLEYILSDGTVGLARPGKWKRVEKRGKR